MTMLKPQNIGDRRALRSVFAPHVFCHSPLLMGLGTITAGLEVLPLFVKLRADMAVQVLAALLCQCLQSCYLAGLPVQCQVERKPLRLHLLFYLLG